MTGEIPCLSPPAGTSGDAHRATGFAEPTPPLVFGFLYLPVLILIVFSFNNHAPVAVFFGLFHRVVCDIVSKHRTARSGEEQPASRTHYHGC
ncbi:MAG: hypothetical protein MZV70_21450 [Desulfobacterales bacterium]|nr:hypothetical protein [Desulfobacterales bacterium]